MKKELSHIRKKINLNLDFRNMFNELFENVELYDIIFDQLLDKHKS
jgi:hypothetical protein